MRFWAGIGAGALALMVSVALLSRISPGPATPGLETLVRIDGEGFGKAELEQALGIEAVFADRVRAEEVLRRFVDLTLAERQRLAEGRAGTALGWLDQEARARGLVRPVGEDAIARHYETHRSRWVHPQQVRLAVLEVPAMAESRHVQSLYLQAQMSPRRAPFGGYLRDLDRHLVARDVGLVACDGSTAGSPPQSVLAAACRARVGALLPPLQAGKQAYLVRVEGLRPGRKISVAEATPEIRAHLAKEREREGRQRLRDLLRADAKVQFHEAAIASLVRPVAERLPVAWPPPQQAPGPPTVPGRAG